MIEFTGLLQLDPICEKIYGRLAQKHGFHVVTLQSETDGPDEGRAEEINILGIGEQAQTLDTGVEEAKLLLREKGSHH